MTARRVSLAFMVLASLGALCIGTAASAVELQGLKGYQLDTIYGRYAPGGDCKRQPQVVADATGLTFEVGGKSEKVTNPEQAMDFNGPDYQGSDIWIFPFRLKDGYSILMTFNPNSKKGALEIAPQDEGYPGGPKLSPRNQALVSGSPYARCK
ncbi:MAG TPA: hypothetical protein PK163_09470 [Steroidobacteraceae bacterium]|nr:hypothetical protein [Steroidobacteraceae bacterium]